MSVLNAEEKGKDTMLLFHRRMVELWAGYSLTENEFLDYIQGLNPWFFDTFGKAIGNATSLSRFEIIQTMQSVADASKGRMPQEARDLIIFYDALLKNYDFGKLSTWTRLGGEVIEATKEDVKTAAKIGLSITGVIAVVGVAVLALVYLPKGNR